MTQHFVQYHKLSENNPVPDTFTAKTSNPVPVKTGDVMWLLTGKASASGSQYAFVYWFKVEGTSQTADGATRLVGSQGKRFAPAWAVSVREMPWFATLFQKVLGSGAFGCRPVPAELVPALEAQMAESEGPNSSLAIGDDVTASVEAAEPGTEDERQLRAVLTRRGQQRFRDQLLQAYGRRCAISESRVEQLLEAAHIVPHAEGSDYRVSNGLLLRADLHTLFDLHLLGIDGSLRVHLHPSLRHSEYARYQGKRIESLPASSAEWPSPSNLQSRFARYIAKAELAEMACA
ncbi:HNH endonuclease [Roseateles toxinivorans]|uniref:HNH endonuclease n=1 Tax=Roseateles toxinivorans TaxID=270368 RepID=A0A4R6QUA2_9BURK|nr:HNH endonuclease [Roseateles toxinivorans]TDP74743.1 HNH endonuclease [Roseateles toxinivorans]